MILNYIETHLVDHCNLNCKGCGHFSSVAPKTFADFATFERDFRRLAELFENILRIRLMGGEPLLHPEVTKFTECVRRIFPRATISLVTNGLLLPSQPTTFWESCATHDIMIQLTRYPIKLHLEEIAATAARFGAKINISPEVSSFFQFMNFAGDSEPATSFRNCQARFKCSFLREGRISPCVLPATMHLFNQRFQTNIPVSKDDSIDIFGDTQASEILDFLKHPLPMCRWCLPEWPTFDWKIGTKTIDDWVPQPDPRLPILQ